jgi:hypothetical protein
LAACSPAQEEAEPSQDAETLLKEIRSLAGVARASTPDQCKILSLGPKPCGGHERHLIYSTEHAQEAQMLEHAAEYNALIEARYQQSDEAMACEYQPAPQTTLNGGLCIPVETALQ